MTNNNSPSSQLKNEMLQAILKSPEPKQSYLDLLIHFETSIKECSKLDAHDPRRHMHSSFCLARTDLIDFGITHNLADLIHNV